MKREYQPEVEMKVGSGMSQEIQGHDELSYVKRNLEAWTDRALTAESSLELAVKALQWYADSENWKARERCGNCGHHLASEIDRESAEWDAGDLAQSTLDRIRGIET